MSNDVYMLETPPVGDLSYVNGLEQNFASKLYEMLRAFACSIEDSPKNIGDGAHFELRYNL